jgi:serine/threonine-protein kinase
VRLYYVRVGGPLPSLRGPIDGKYRVERVIGEGGMGVVVEARHVVLGTRHALKILVDAHDPVLRQRFVRVAQACASLTSAHAIRVFDVGTLPTGEPYMVMELLEGCDLRQLVAEHGPRPLGEAVGYILQACDALAEAHGRGMVHRDIKLENLFLCRGSRVVKLLDFGVSKGIIAGRAPLNLTDTDALLGTPHFMAPEQLVSSRDVDARADIWSLGATLFELLSGDVPFDGVSVTDVFSAVVHLPPRSLRGLRPDVPIELERAVMRCLEKDAGRRYADVAGLVRDLAPFHGDGRTSLARVTDRLLAVASTSPVDVPTVPLTGPLTRPLALSTPQTAPPAARLPVERGRGGWLVGAALAAVAAVALPAWWLGTRASQSSDETNTEEEVQEPKEKAKTRPPPRQQAPSSAPATPRPIAPRPTAKPLALDAVSEADRALLRDDERRRIIAPLKRGMDALRRDDLDAAIER